MFSHVIFQWNNMITEMPAKKTPTHNVRAVHEMIMHLIR